MVLSYFFVDIRKTIGLSSNGNIITDDIVFAEELLDKEHVTVIPGNGIFVAGICSNLLYQGARRDSFRTERNENVFGVAILIGMQGHKLN